MATHEDQAHSASRPLLERLKHLLGVDFHILQTLLLRGWSVLAGGIMILFVPYWFDQAEQGYYYTFNSLLAIQIFFELGMNQVVVQIVSHEAAHVTQNPDGSLSGDAPSISRLASFSRLLRRWYLAAATLFFLIGGAVGVVFFSLNHQGQNGGEISIWLMLAFFTAMNLYISPSLAMLEGFGHVGDVARVRLTQTIAGYLLMWTALSFGAGLAAAPLLVAAAAAYSAFWLACRDRRIRWLRREAAQRREATLSWKRDVFPLQWRIAMSWISGYLILQLLVPLAFANQGAVEAGRLGLTLTVFNSLLSMGLSWVNARLPTLARHLARGERNEAKHIFRGVLLRSSIITAAGCLAIGMMVSLLPELMRIRFADVWTILLLGLATVVNCVSYAMATFARAHRVEPLLVQSVASALIMAPAVYLGSLHSISVMAFLFLLVAVAVSLPWVAMTFRRYYEA